LKATNILRAPLEVYLKAITQRLDAQKSPAPGLLTTQKLSILKEINYNYKERNFKKKRQKWCWVRG
jgi:hypothetical protein